MTPHPPDGLSSPAAAAATAFCARPLAEPDAFWREQAARIHWQRPFDAVCDFSRPPFARWFVGGETNLCFNAVDRHVARATRGDQPAIRFISTETDERRTLTYRELQREVSALAAVFRELGLQRGDGVVIYLPMVPEAPVAMLACVRLGLVHTVVFGGFAPASLATRVDDVGAELLITADAGSRGGKRIPLKRLADEAQALARTPAAHVLVLDRGLDRERPWTEGRDLDYATVVGPHRAAGTEVPCVWLESSEPSYLLYTSGTTARPKGIQRDTGGYAVALAASMAHVFPGEPGETMFTAADIGWAVGHSYTCYGPLLRGMTTVVYEGLPTRPDGGIWWRIVEEERVSLMFTSPTAIRVLKKQDPDCFKRHDLSSLRYLYLAGEPLDEPTSRWVSESVGVPVIDNYWQTETGWPALTLLPGVGLPPDQARLPRHGRLRLRCPDRPPRDRRPRARRREGHPHLRPAAAAGVHDDGVAERRDVRPSLLRAMAGQAAVFHLRLGRAGRGWLPVHPRPHGRRHQRGRPPPRHPRDRGGRLRPPRRG